MHPRIKSLLSPSLGFAVIVAFSCWAAVFIYTSSVPLHGGGRTFCLFDDAMISMRYADNLAHGNGPVWNSGKFVEGYTNPLMIAVMALFLAITSKSLAVLLVQILGALFALSTALLSVRIYKRLAEPAHQIPCWLVCFFILAIYTLSYWAIMGMETGFVALFLTIGVYAATGNSDTQTDLTLRRAMLLALSGAGLYLSRPDALSFAVLIFAFIVLVDRKARTLKLAFLAASVIVAVVAAHLAFRLTYYGRMLPNTALLKLGHFPLSYRALGGIGYVLPFLRGVFPLVFLALFSAIMKRNHAKWLILSLFAVSISYQIFVGGDPWPYWRIMSPTMPLLLILAADGAFRLSVRIVERVPSRLASLMLTVCLMLWACHQYDKPFLQELLLLSSPYQIESNRRNVNTAYAIRNLTKETASVGVFWAGSIPFYSERYAVDFLGKSDPQIADRKPDLSGTVSAHGMSSLPGHNKYDLTASIVERQPTYIQNTRWGSDDVTAWASNHYISVSHMGATMLLLKDSPDVIWERLENIANKRTESGKE